MKILVINAGSSSLKYQLIDMETEAVLAKGLCERIGIGGHLKHTPLVEGKSVFNEDIDLPTHAEAISAVIDKLTSREHGVVSSMKEIDAVGHRVVHVSSHHEVALAVGSTADVGITLTALDACMLFWVHDGASSHHVLVVITVAADGIGRPLSAVAHVTVQIAVVALLQVLGLCRHHAGYKCC